MFCNHTLVSRADCPCLHSPHHGGHSLPMIPHCAGRSLFLFIIAVFVMGIICCCQGFVIAIIVVVAVYCCHSFIYHHYCEFDHDGYLLLSVIHRHCGGGLDGHLL